MDRAEKGDLVATLHQTFRKTAVVVVAHYSGLTVAEIGDLRSKMREAGAHLKVTKNTLTKLALPGTPYQGLEAMFKGPTAIAYSSDAVATAKVATAYAKTNAKLIILGGGLGSQVLDAEGVKALATMPPIEEFRGKIVGLLQAPAARLVGIMPQPAVNMVGVLKAPAVQMVGVLKAYADKQEAA